MEPSNLQVRDSVLLEHARKKRVVDVGFLDKGSLSSKVAEGSWLHDKIRKVADDIVGVDIDEDGINHVREKFGIVAYCCDLSLGAPPTLVEFKPELIICADVVEHIPNPQQFLLGVRDLAGRTGATLVVTVPNATSYVTVAAAFRRFETINTDHRFYFSPYTVSKILWDAGFKVDRVELAASSWGGNKLKSKCRRVALRHLPLLRDTCIAFARPR
jgi:hypothetical protein